MPSFEDIRRWFGVIFVRRGHYANAIFKFRVELPAEYNDKGTWPRVVFTTPIFNPLVDPVTKEFHIKYFYPQWDPHDNAKCCYMVGVLTYLKKIFYLDNEFYTKCPANMALNSEALKLYKTDKAQFIARVTACVQASQDTVYENEPGSSLPFTEPKPVHDSLRQTVLAPYTDTVL
ncbi:unnamed protein product [Chrysoparadoxa australica]